MVTFTDKLQPLSTTMVFEKSYPPELREDLDTKSRLIHYGLCAWLYVDGEIAGEILGASPIWLTNVTPEPIPDVSEYDSHSYYCYSTTILPNYRGVGYGRLLKSYMIGQLHARKYFKMIGHSTSPTMNRLNEFFGAIFDPRRIHENWYDSGRQARYYEIPLLESPYLLQTFEAPDHAG